jgi:hypothetical protein
VCKLVVEKFEGTSHIKDLSIGRRIILYGSGQNRVHVAVTSFHAVLNVILNCWGHKSGNSLGQLSVSYIFKEDYSKKLA